MIEFSKASNNQLLAIVNHENADCPAPLWSGAVIEAINRNLFDGLIAKSIKSVITPDVVEKIHKVSMEDFMQIGRLEVFKVKDRFQFGKGRTFLSFIYTAVKHEIIRQMDALEAGKRDTRHVMSYQNKTMNGEEYEIFLHDRKINVEKYVVNKVTLEQLLKRVNQHQRTVLHYYLQGYTFEEISKILGRGSLFTMSQAYNLAIKKMKKGA